MAKGFGQDVAGILLAVNEVEPDGAGWDGLANTVIGQCIPMLGEGGVGNGRACDGTLVVWKRPGWAIQWDTQHMEGETEVNDLLNGCVSSNKLHFHRWPFRLGLGAWRTSPKESD